MSSKFHHQVWKEELGEEDLGVTTLEKPQGWGGREWLGGSSLFLTGQGQAALSRIHKNTGAQKRMREAGGFMEKEAFEMNLKDS